MRKVGSAIVWNGTPAADRSIRQTRQPRWAYSVQVQLAGPHGAVDGCIERDGGIAWVPRASSNGLPVTDLRLRVSSQDAR
jgi:hypothetical protein